MNWDRIKGKWKKAKRQKGQENRKFTDDDLKVINDKREELVGREHESSVTEKEDAKKRSKRF
ncbi:MAG: hypothetical protein WBB23_08885 [Desulforhopalus sp.]